MNYPNGKPYRKNSAIDGGKKTAAFRNIRYGGRGMSLEKYYRTFKYVLS